MTTELSADGEKQLASIASATGGMIVRSEQGETGIDKVAARLTKMMREELSERVESVFDDVFYAPLGLAALLLIVEALVFEAPRKRRSHA